MNLKSIEIDRWVCFKIVDIPNILTVAFFASFSLLFVNEFQNSEETRVASKMEFTVSSTSADNSSTTSVTSVIKSKPRSDKGKEENMQSQSRESNAVSQI